MATKTILGTLLDASGVTPIGNATIRFVSTSTRSIINGITTDFYTSSTGTYNFSVLHGVYTIQIRRQEELQFRTICANAYIYDDIPESLELVIRAQAHIQELNDETTIQEMLSSMLAQTNTAALTASLIAQHNASAVAHHAVSRSITPVGDTAILDLVSATVFLVTLNAHITQIGFTNALGEEGSSRSVTLILRQGTGVNLVSWPENIRWAYGHLPVLSYEKDAEDYITLVNFGTDPYWYGFLTGGWFHV